MLNVWMLAPCWVQALHDECILHPASINPAHVNGTLHTILRGWLHGEFQPGLKFQPSWTGWKKTRLHGKFQPGLKLNVRAGTVVFLYLLLYTRVVRMRLWIFSPGWNFLSITWGISARSTGLKISSWVAQTGLKFQMKIPIYSAPKPWNYFLYISPEREIQQFDWFLSGLELPFR